MKVLFIDPKARKTAEFQFGITARIIALASFCLLPFVAGFGGYALAVSLLPSMVDTGEQVAELQSALKNQRKAIDNIRADAQRKVDGLSIRMAEIQARVMRLDALGERVAEVAQFDKDEFNFSTLPAMGGVFFESELSSVDIDDFQDSIAAMERTLESREQQLDVISQLLKNRDLSKQMKVEGWPVESGWISSRYGSRNDPFTGKVAAHYGVDFASKYGSPISSVAAGVVTWSGNRSGYGLTVEVSHGGGYMTRYAHTSESLVSVGQLVKKDEAIAKIGQSGRSTGPHLHFEVFKNGRNVDPASYIRRTNRS